MTTLENVISSCTRLIELMIDSPLYKGKIVSDFNDLIYKHYQNIPDDQKSSFEDFFKLIESHFEVDEAPPIVKEYDIGGWLDSFIRINAQPHWNYYKELIRKKNKGGMIPYLEADTYSILDCSMNPKEKGVWDRRGLVYGDVQSGKTSNYIGLINRAFDTGYRIVIIFTGMTEDLRKQTQDRVNEGINGKDEHNNRYGVGKLKGFPFGVNKGTTMVADFSTNNLPTQIANLSLNDKIVFVVKKNVTILNNLIYWLKKKSDEQNKEVYKIQKTPFLVIDDEADNASIDSISRSEKETGDYDLNAINRNIRLILSLMEMKTFIAYTATPYSVVLQKSEDIGREYTINGIQYQVDENSDLFPKDFIIPIRHGDNYLGIERIFGSEDQPELPIVTQIDQHPRFNESLDDLREIFPTGSDEYSFSEIPESLKEAIQHYLISCIIRDFRKQDDHNTMLIHTSHNVSKIDYLAARVSDYLKQLYNLVLDNNKTVIDGFKKIHGGIRENSKNPLFTDLFSPEAPYSNPELVTRKDILEKITRVTLVSLHSRKNDPSLEHKNHILNYKSSSSQDYIVVGGNRLSRGLTIEGLHTSYFIRSASRKDSLYQMGRWFGYRSGYEDCVRIYTNSDLYMWFHEIMILESRLRSNIDEMNSQDHMTPSNWEIAVSRSIERDSLNRSMHISDPNKLRHAANRRMSFGGLSLRTKYFETDNESQKENIAFTKRFLLENIDEGYEFRENSYPKNDANINLKGVPVNKVIQFLEIFSFHDKQSKDFEDLIQYLKENEEISSFSVVLKRLKSGREEKHENGRINFSDVTRKNVAPKGSGYYEINALLDGDKDNTFDIITDENLDSYLEAQDPAKYRAELRKDNKTALLILYSINAPDIPEIDGFISLYLYLPKIGSESNVLARV